MYKVYIQKLDNEGRGIGYINGKIVFVENALPEEIVNVKITKENKKICEAKVIEYVKKSDKRKEAVCKYYGKCGGCNLMHLSYDDELNYKEQKVKEILKKYANIESSKVKKIIYGSNLYYRNKVTLKVNKKIGYYEKESNNLVIIDECKIVDKKINEIIKILQKENLENVYEIMIRTSDDDSMILFKTKSDIYVNYDKLNVGTILVYNKKYKLIKGNEKILEKIGNYKYLVSNSSFFQVNKEVAYKLYSKIKEYVKNSSSLLDLYCGTGSIGIFLSDICEKIYGVEINKQSIVDANENKKINKLNNIEFLCSDVANLNNVEYFDTIVIDPPRSGLDKKSINFVLNQNPEKIVYVSCNPITLSRDLNILKEKYEVVEITPFDMFCRTEHVECVSLLYRKGIEK